MVIYCFLFNIGQNKNFKSQILRILLNYECQIKTVMREIVKKAVFVINSRVEFTLNKLNTLQFLIIENYSLDIIVSLTYFFRTYK